MAWKTRGLRGSFFEEIINLTNEHYRDKKIALVQKIPTPITPIEIDKSTRHITLAYFDQKSTVDYIGIAQGVPLCFDCKECAVDTFTMANVHPHQVQFMKEFKSQGGVAFILIYYSKRDMVYYMRIDELDRFFARAENGGRKSVAFDELDEKFLFPVKQSMYINYLEFVNVDLENEEKD